VVSGAGAGTGAAGARARGGGTLQLIVEKNFRVYAYTDVDLHVALLALFCRVETRLPNLVVATLTRRSALTAFANGISAQQVAHFLRQRVHPIMTSQGAGVPENVIDQLVIWEEERHRASFEPAVMVGGFETAASFRECVAFAGREGALEWSDEARLQVLVKRAAVDALKAFMRSKGLGGGGGGGRT
jgi:transcription initiation factor TFIIH subunit 4